MGHLTKPLPELSISSNQINNNHFNLTTGGRMSDPYKAEIIDDSQSSDSNQLLMLDNLLNIVTGLGLGKSECDEWTQGYLNQDFSQLEAAFRTDWLARKVVSILPEDMAYNWRKFSGDLEPELIEELEAEEHRLDIKDKFRQAEELARLYGTSYIILVVDGTGEPHTELKWKSIKPNSLKDIKVFDRRYMRYQGTLTTDPFDDNYFLPEYYSVAESAVRIHYSRVLRFEGNNIPRMQFKENQYCSDSVLVALEKAIKAYSKTVQSTAAIVDEASVDVLKIKGLFDSIGNPEAEKALRGHIRNLKATKSLHNVTVLDTEDEYENVTNQSMTGLDSLMKTFLEFVAVATDIPVHRFMNSSPGGLNSGDDNSTERKYAEKIESYQTRKWGKNLKILDMVMTLSLDLPIDFTDEVDLHKALTYDWVSIIPDDPIQDEELFSKQIDNFSKLLDIGILTEEVIAKEIHQMDKYSNFNKEEVEEVVKAAQEADEMAKAAQQAEFNSMSGESSEQEEDVPPESDGVNEGPVEPLEYSAPNAEEGVEDGLFSVVEEYKNTLDSMED